MASPADQIAARCGRASIGFLCRRALRRDAVVRVEGSERVPRSGPVLLVARHVHHALDGCILERTLRRRLHILVAIDWVPPGWRRRLMAWACRVMRWPAVIRDDHRTPVEPGEAARFLRTATRDAVQLLRDGGLLLVFPEGYPNVDPNPTPKPDLDAWLPFDPGFVTLARLAERDGRTRVAIVPVGFHYERRGERWEVVARLDPPRFLPPDVDGFVREIEARVWALSRP